MPTGCHILCGDSVIAQRAPHFPVNLQEFLYHSVTVSISLSPLRLLNLSSRSALAQILYDNTSSRNKRRHQFPKLAFSGVSCQGGFPHVPGRRSARLCFYLEGTAGASKPVAGAAMTLTCAACYASLTREAYQFASASPIWSGESSCR
jgi:hypothetical protein